MTTNRISETTLTELFDEALDEQGLIKIGNLEYYPSQVLKSVDPIAYDLGKWEYADFLAEDGTLVEGFNDEGFDQ